MTNKSKHMPYYIILCGFLGMSIGFNFVQHEEIKLLKQEKTMYRVFFEYLYLKLETLQNKNFVYNNDTLGAKCIDWIDLSKTSK
jgi:hypothetical protein